MFPPRGNWGTIAGDGDAENEDIHNASPLMYIFSEVYSIQSKAYRLSVITVRLYLDIT